MMLGKYSLLLLVLVLVPRMGSAESDHMGNTPKFSYITIDADAVSSTNKSFGPQVEIIEVRDGVAIAKIKSNTTPFLSQHMHDEHHRCGGFVAHESLEEAKAALASVTGEMLLAEKGVFKSYTINSQDVVRPLVAQVKAVNIEATIRKLSSFHNRYYQAQTGVDSQKWLKGHWESLLAGRNDAKVELFEHSRWKQPSVIATIEGESEEIIIVGGHADSISGYFGRDRARAPGADDNASGISTITEIIRILSDSGYKPKKTIQFMGYAAEEVGLLGSKDIAQTYKREGKDVIGVVQLDMTNFQGSDQAITLITDYTNAEQNKFMGGLIDEYVKVSWGTDRCGYACSDHASWHGQGFPASMPFEAKKANMNRNIHTSRDTIEVSGGNAEHASKFAKLGISFIVELDK